MDETRNVRIFMIDDNHLDVILTRETFAESEKSRYHISSATDGAKAIDFLVTKRRNGEAGLPDLILLDLNSPGMHGFECLELIRRHEMLRAIPVFILTTSAVDEDAARAMELDAQGFFVKPLDLSLFEETLCGHRGRFYPTRENTSISSRTS